jgi:hypothetical protein
MLGVGHGDVERVLGCQLGSLNRGDDLPLR